MRAPASEGRIICQVCHEEIRLAASGDYLHNPAQDAHHAGVPRTREPESLEPVELDVDDESEDLIDGDDIPAPDIWAHEIGPEAEIMAGGARILYKAVTRAGGKAVATHSRGPRVHASQGHLLEMSDYIMVRFAHQGRRAVARWVMKAGKWVLDCGYTYYYDRDLKALVATAASSDDIRAHLLKWQGPLREDGTS